MFDWLFGNKKKAAKLLEEHRRKTEWDIYEAEKVEREKRREERRQAMLNSIKPRTNNVMGNVVDEDKSVYIQSAHNQDTTYGELRAQKYKKEEDERRKRNDDSIVSDIFTAAAIVSSFSDDSSSGSSSSYDSGSSDYSGGGGDFSGGGSSGEY